MNNRSLFLGCLLAGLSVGPGLLRGYSAEPVHRPRILERKPHDDGAFTQGLLIDGEHWLESTGGYGKSELREVERKTGKVLRKFSLPDDQFGEGLALLDGKLYQLTWRKGLLRVFDRKTFEVVREHAYQGEGWGLASDGRELYLSDGSAVVRVMDPETFKERRRFRVTSSEGAVKGLNELEWVEGELWANVFGSNLIVRIQPRDGKVLGYLDLRHLPIMMDRRPGQDVMNGIARDPETGELWVTGKLWNALYRIEWPPEKP